jgi:enoyl reductase-like protein
LGEPIHKVVTQAVKLCEEFDNTVFKLMKEKQELWVAEKKEEVVGKLNWDFAKLGSDGKRMVPLLSISVI